MSRETQRQDKKQTLPRINTVFLVVKVNVRVCMCVFCVVDACGCVCGSH